MYNTQAFIHTLPSRCSRTHMFSRLTAYNITQILFRLKSKAVSSKQWRTYFWLGPEQICLSRNFFFPSWGLVHFFFTRSSSNGLTFNNIITIVILLVRQSEYTAYTVRKSRITVVDDIVKKLIAEYQNSSKECFKI